MLCHGHDSYVTRIELHCSGELKLEYDLLPAAGYPVHFWSERRGAAPVPRPAVTSGPFQSAGPWVLGDAATKSRGAHLPSWQGLPADAGEASGAPVP